MESECDVRSSGPVGHFAIIETAQGQWLVYDTRTAEAFDTAEEAADALALRSGDDLLAQYNDREQPPGRQQ